MGEGGRGGGVKGQGWVGGGETSSRLPAVAVALRMQTPSAYIKQPTSAVFHCELLERDRQNISCHLQKVFSHLKSVV